jgi:hypothetical protein
VGVATTSRSTMTISGSLHAAINPTMQISPKMRRIDSPVLPTVTADGAPFARCILNLKPVFCHSRPLIAASFAPTS